jgi:hypothetical protein
MPVSYNEAIYKLNQQTLTEIADLRQEAVRIMNLFDGMIKEKLESLDMLGLESFRYIPENNPYITLRITRNGKEIELFATPNNN